MQFGLMTEPQLGMTYETITHLASWAESAGLVAFARSDHYAFGGVEGPHATDAFATLGGLARDTGSVELAVLVSPITFRHPAVIAKMAATIDEMSGGRLRLGVGTGWMEKEHTDYGFDFHDQSGRFTRLEEALQYLHHAFGRIDGPFHGEHYRLEETTVRPLPTGDLPIIVGGSGPQRTPRLAGRWADEFNLFSRAPEEIRVRNERAREAAAQAGRDPDDLLLSVMTAVITGPDRPAYEENLARIAAADPFGRSAADLETRYRERGLPIGTADEAQEAVAGLAAVGVERIYVQWFGPYEDDLLESTFGALRGE